MKCKKIIDYRKIDRNSKEELRIGAVNRVQNGESPEKVAEGMGINRRTIYRWLEQYHYGGVDALKKKPIKGATPKVNAQQMEQLSKIIRDKDPLQYKFEFALWTLPIIRKLIKELFEIHISEISVGRIMKRLGFTAQRPLFRAWQQNPQLVENWKKNEYSKIKKRAKREKALIFFADESGVRSDYHAGTTWAPKGKTPIIKATGARYSLNIISAVNANGHFRFMIVDSSMNAKVFLSFIKKLIYGIEQKIFLIVDGHPAHKAKMVKQFVEENKTKIELFYLPPYSPELNPDELAWANLKAGISKHAPLTKDDLKKTVISLLRKLQKRPNIVSNFFKMPTCEYIIS